MDPLCERRTLFVLVTCFFLFFLRYTFYSYIVSQFLSIICLILRGRDFSIFEKKRKKGGGEGGKRNVCDPSLLVVHNMWWDVMNNTPHFPFGPSPPSRLFTLLSLTHYAYNSFSAERQPSRPSRVFRSSPLPLGSPYPRVPHFFFRRKILARQ